MPGYTGRQTESLTNTDPYQKMGVIFWGTRGSLPFGMTAEMIRKKIRTALAVAGQKGIGPSVDPDRFMDAHLPFSVTGGYGCNTACVEITGGDETVICDAGTGLRDLGSRIMEAGDRSGTGRVFHLFLSHPHWDHIQGFPFFTPAYIPGNTIHIYGFHDDLEAVFRNQQAPPGFPVPLSALGADIRFNRLDLGKSYDIAGFTVTGIEQNHPGRSYGYAFAQRGKKVVYCTDSEHKIADREETDRFIRFCRNADVLVIDAQYQLLDSLDGKENWGHSSNIVVTELAVQAGAARLCLFHHEHTWDDIMLEQFLEETRQYLRLYDRSSTIAVDLAYDGMRIILDDQPAAGKADPFSDDENQQPAEKGKQDIVVVDLSGRMDSEACPGIEKMLQEKLVSADRGLVLNMEALEYVSSAGLRTIIALKKHARNASKQVMMCNLSGMVRDVFVIAGFSSFINLDLSLDQCMDELSTDGDRG